MERKGPRGAPGTFCESCTTLLALTTPTLWTSDHPPPFCLLPPYPDSTSLRESSMCVKILFTPWLEPGWWRSECVRIAAGQPTSRVRPAHRSTLAVHRNAVQEKPPTCDVSLPDLPAPTSRRWPSATIRAYRLTVRRRMYCNVSSGNPVPRSYGFAERTTAPRHAGRPPRETAPVATQSWCLARGWGPNLVCGDLVVEAEFFAGRINPGMSCGRKSSAHGLS